MPGNPVLRILLIIFVFGAGTHTANAQLQPHDRTALAGLKQVKIVFDVTQGDPDKLLSRLKLISDTAKSVRAEGITPDFILAVRGPASFLMSKDLAASPNGELKLPNPIAAQIDMMTKSQGLRFELCAVAMNARKISRQSVIPSVKVVGNSWVSLGAYQNKGYAFIAID